MMQLRILGMNGPFPESGGATSGYLVTDGDTALCLDLGCGTLGALTSLTKPEDLNGILFSHWHYDHTSDVLPLLYRLQAAGRQMDIWGPEDAKSPIRSILEAETAVRLHVLKPGDTLKVGQVEIQVFRAVHPVPALMFRLTDSDGVLCYTGDTNAHGDLLDFARGADILLADGLFPEADWTASKPHLSARRCAELARDARAGQLIITHLNPNYAGETLLQEARTVFHETALARRMDLWHVSRDGNVKSGRGEA